MSLMSDFSLDNKWLVLCLKMSYAIWGSGSA